MLDDDAKAQVLKSLESVGISKAVGYLPLRTIKNHLRWQHKDATRYCRSKNLESTVIGPRSCCIDGGALYAWSEQMLQKILIENRQILFAAGRDDDCNAFIQYIGQTWLPGGDPLLPIVKRAFGEFEAEPWWHS